MQLARLLTVSAPLPSPSSRHAAWSPRKKRWFKLHMKKWGLFGTLVDVEKIKARKLHLVMYGCFGTEVDADIIEARKQALRDWWTPARRQAASERWTPEMRKELSDAWTPVMRQEASDLEKARWTPEMRQEASDAWTPARREAASDAAQEWWTDERRDDKGDLMMKWWDDEEEGVTRREACSLATYYGHAAARGDTDPLDPIWIPAGTVCPKCDNQLGQRVILTVGFRLHKPDPRRNLKSTVRPAPILAFRCPHKTCTARGVSLLSASHRAAVLSTIPDGEGGEALEQAIVERLALVVDTFNAAKRDEATRLGVAFSPVVISAKATGRI